MPLDVLNAPADDAPDVELFENVQLVTTVVPDAFRIAAVVVEHELESNVLFFIVKVPVELIRMAMLLFLNRERSTVRVAVPMYITPPQLPADAVLESNSES